MRASWDLLSRGPREVCLIELARGRITGAMVPAVRSDGPVSFVPDQRVTRPRLTAPLRAGPERALPYSSPEKRSQADCRVVPSTAPIRVQVILRARALRTQAVSCRSA